MLLWSSVKINLALLIYEEATTFLTSQARFERGQFNSFFCFHQGPDEIPAEGKEAPFLFGSSEKSSNIQLSFSK